LRLLFAKSAFSKSGFAKSNLAQCPDGAGRGFSSCLAPASPRYSAQWRVSFRSKGCFSPSAAAGRNGDAASRSGGRLHRFLRVDVPRDERGQVVPSRQSLAAELQIYSDWLSRTRIVAGKERDSCSSAIGSNARWQCRSSSRSEVWADEGARLRA